jgi:hypothetical protein
MFTAGALLVVFSALTPQLEKDTHFTHKYGDLGNLQLLLIMYGNYLYFAIIRHSYPFFINFRSYISVIRDALFIQFINN